MFDAAHDHQPIVDAIAGRRVKAIVLTHGHNDHINAAVPLRDVVDAPILAHPDDQMLWDAVWPDDSLDGEVIARRRARASPGTSWPWCTRRATRPDVAASTTPPPASCSRRHVVLRRAGRHRPQLQRRADDPALDHRRSCSRCPPETIVHTGHGDTTTIGAERDGVLDRAAELGARRSS